MYVRCACCFTKRWKSQLKSATIGYVCAWLRQSITKYTYHTYGMKRAHTHARTHAHQVRFRFWCFFSQISIKKHCKQLQKLTIKITAGDANDAIARICPFSTVNQIKYIKMHTHGVHARYIAESRAWCMCLSVCLTREGETIRIK